MLTFSAATRAARCVVANWTQLSGDVLHRRTIVLQQCPPGKHILSRDPGFKSAALAALSSQRSLFTSAQALSESTKASAAAAEGEEGDEKPKYKPLTKWQKWGYIFFGANMFALVIGRHVFGIKR